jgi:hypothetical protein
MTSVFCASKVTVTAKWEFVQCQLEAENAATQWSEERHQQDPQHLEIEVYRAIWAAQASFRHTLMEKYN